MLNIDEMEEDNLSKHFLTRLVGTESFTEPVVIDTNSDSGCVFRKVDGVHVIQFSAIVYDLLGGAIFCAGLSNTHEMRRDV